MPNHNNRIDEDMVFRFDMRDLSMKVFPELEGDASRPDIIQACGNFLQSAVEFCTPIHTVCIAHPSNVCIVAVTNCPPGNLETNNKCTTPPTVKKCVYHTCDLVGSPTKERCEKGSKTACNAKTKCDKGSTVCNNCTELPTVCHCTHDAATVCAPGSPVSCKDTKICNGDGNTCADGNNVTGGCGCTNADCSVPCTNAKSAFPPNPSPAEKTTASAELLAQLKADLLARMAS